MGGQSDERARVVLLGAGGHARAVLDALLAQGGCEVIGLLDDNPELHGREVFGYRVLGPTEAAGDVGATHFVAAVGENNRVRAKLYERGLAAGLSPWPVIHPAAVISPRAEIGPGIQALPGAIVVAGACIGENVVLNTACSVDHDCQIGDHVFIAPGARLGGNVAVGRFVLIGIGAAVLPGRAIGEGSIVGAGAVVTRDIAPGVVAYGVPARPARSV